MDYDTQVIKIDHNHRELLKNISLAVPKTNRYRIFQMELKW